MVTRKCDDAKTTGGLPSSKWPGRHHVRVAVLFVALFSCIETGFIDILRVSKAGEAVVIFHILLAGGYLSVICVSYVESLTRRDFGVAFLHWLVLYRAP